MDAKDFINQQLAATGWAPINHDLAKLLCPGVANVFRDFIAYQNTPQSLASFPRTALCRARVEGFGEVLIIYRGPLALAERIAFLTGGAVEIVDGKEANKRKASISQIVAPTSGDKLAMQHADVQTKEPPRPCKQCGGLSSSQTCLVAQRGEIEGAPSDYQPDLVYPRRCMSYLPPRIIEGYASTSDYDRRTGRELWPEVVTFIEQRAAAHDEGASPAEKARKLLADMLKDGPRDAAEILVAAEGASVSERTMQRAADMLGVVKTKAGFGGGWVWELPRDCAA